MNHSQAPCAQCSRLTNLELWPYTGQMLCKACSINHFQKWKQEQVNVCAQIEANLDFYKNQIEQFTSTVNTNLKSISLIKDQVEEIYANFLRVLNQEKSDILTRLNDFENENKMFLNFKNETNLLKQNMLDFKDDSRIYEENGIGNALNKFTQTYQSLQMTDQKYKSLMSQPLRHVPKFERAPLPRADVKHLGELDSSELTQLAPRTASNNSFNNSIRETALALQNASLSAIKPLANETSNASRIATSNMKTNLNNFNNWITKAAKDPFQEIQIDRAPLFLTGYRNRLFCVDEKGTLTLFTLTTSNKLELNNVYKIPLQNVRSIAANLNFFGITYSSLDKKYLKSNRSLKQSGVVLYARDQDVVSFRAEKLIDLNNGETFEYPIGLALNEQHVFVCDKCLKSVYKIDLTTHAVLNRISMNNGGEPYKLSLNENYLLVSDTLNHFLNLYELNDFGLIKNFFLNSSDKKNGPFSVHLTNDNIIFFKNDSNSNLTLTDISLSNRQLFSKIKANIEGFTMLECANQILVVGCTEKNSFKLLLYSNI